MHENKKISCTQLIQMKARYTNNSSHRQKHTGKKADILFVLNTMWMQVPS